MIKTQLLIGADSMPITVFQQNGTAFTTPPCVVLHSTEMGKYYIADKVTGKNGGIWYDAVFSKSVTANMNPGVYALEIYNDNNMTAMLGYDCDYCEAVIAATTDGQTNGETQEQTNES